MYEYNFNDIRKTIEEILDKSLTKSKEAYYNQLEIFKNDQDDNESLKDVKVKKKKNYNERSIEWTSKYREGSNRF